MSHYATLDASREGCSSSLTVNVDFWNHDAGAAGHGCRDILAPANSIRQLLSRWEGQESRGKVC